MIARQQKQRNKNHDKKIETTAVVEGPLIMAIMFAYDDDDSDARTSAGVSSFLKKESPS